LHVDGFAHRHATGNGIRPYPALADSTRQREISLRLYVVDKGLSAGKG
jgi:hypothetical protein